MSCLENQNICTVKKENNQGYYRIHTIWMHDKVRINIASKDSSWTGEISSETLQKNSRELNIDPEKYLAECQKALTTDDGNDNYSYAIENGCFIWKKTVDEDSGIKIRMGSVLVQPVSFIETIQNMMELSLNCKKDLQKQILQLTNQNDKEKQRIEKLESKLAELCDIKNVMENDLYKKFLLLLNSKKRRIKELEESLHIKNESFKDSTRENIKLISKSDSTSSNTYEMDTDDEQQIIEEPEIDLDLSSQSHNKTSNKTCDYFEKCNEDTVTHNRLGNISDTELDSNPKCFNPENLPKMNNTNDVTSKFKDSLFMKDNKYKCFPSTKKDVLNFFFGAND